MLLLSICSEGNLEDVEGGKCFLDRERGSTVALMEGTGKVDKLGFGRFFCLLPRGRRSLEVDDDNPSKVLGILPVQLILT